MRIPDSRRKEGDIIVENHNVREALFGFGEDSENSVSPIFCDPLVEVKTHSWEQVQKTGNLFIEFAAWYPERKDFIPSGIETTKAPYWVFNFYDDNGFKNDVVLCVDTKVLRDVIKRGLERGVVTVKETPPLQTKDKNKGYVVPVMLLLREYLYVTKQPVVDMLVDEREKWVNRKARIDKEKTLNVGKKLFGKRK